MKGDTEVILNQEIYPSLSNISTSSAEVAAAGESKEKESCDMCELGGGEGRGGI